ncbi:hypothetical protein BJ956_001177 [Arthrobacter psychrochitiniphilus]|nr:hypothetical protein [Arthrobacter psychrochitiniphilus]
MRVYATGAFEYLHSQVRTIKYGYATNSGHWLGVNYGKKTLNF